ncbi:PAS domain S-box protein [Natronococcus sp. A-GB7]|uniref:PAS domain S-box protein n=1 Tax=Natronococcus sp. A-GB7 TaxID=3037649 RepID=UPI00241EC5E0|nr:PAS domain S-box protein [Natronococcus sp. A-GB7]MDG5818262.1 PAS domain S-box protein [Natronococcus sp. A-GB7]
MGTISGTIPVLHVDDDPDFAEVAASFLEREDDRFEVETATSVSEGLNRLADGNFDCVVSDYDMPGRNGIEFLEAVREEYPDLPFILHTGKGSEEVASDAISAGVTDYLRKESKTSQYTVLANRIRNAVENYRTRIELANREQRLNLFFEQSPLGVIEWNENSTFVRMNEAAEELLGYTEDDLTGRSWEVIVPESDRDAVDEVVSDLLENKGGYHSVNENVRKTGERIVCEWHNRVVTDHEDDVVAIFSQFQDITELKEQERELRETKRRLELVLEGTEMGLWEWKIGTGKIEWNETLERALGLEPGSFEGTYEAFAKRVHPDDLPQVEDALDQAVETDELYHMEFRMIHGDGDVVWAECPGVIVDQENEPDWMVGLYRDITERKRREKQLETFASIVSHDLRNPLNVARGYLELAREDQESEHLDHVEQAHDRMDGLIEELLTLARKGDTVGGIEPVDLADITENCWENVATPEAALTTEIDREIRANQSRLQQLLENLVRNAVEHGGEDVTVTVGRLENGFYVEDDGPGIPSGDREDVFEAGYSTAEGGTGFGLEIVKQVAQAHGWDVRVVDGTEGGARFEIIGVEFTAE